MWKKSIKSKIMYHFENFYLLLVSNISQYQFIRCICCQNSKLIPIIHFFPAHNAVVTCSVFATNPSKILEQIRRNRSQTDSTEEQSGGGTLKVKSSESNTECPLQGYVIVSGDYDGDIKVFYTMHKPKHSSLPPSAL